MVYGGSEHSFGSLWVYVICQIMARERLQLISWTWQVKNILTKYFDRQVKFDVVSMVTWTIEFNVKISFLLSLHKIRSLDFLLYLVITTGNLFDKILTDGFLDNQ